MHAAIRSFQLGVVGSPTHRECIVADCLAQLRRFLDTDGEFVLHATADGFEINGVQVATDPVTRELHRLLRLAGLRWIYMDRTTDEQQVRRLLGVLGTYRSSRRLPPESRALAARLLSMSFRSLRFSGDCGRRRQAGPGRPSGRTHDWAEEIRAEADRPLALEVTQAVLNDVARVVPGSAYRDRVALILAPLLSRLLDDERFDAAARLLDLVRSSQVLAPKQKAEIEAAVGERCSEDYLRPLLAQPSPTGEAELEAFLTRASGRVAVALLRLAVGAGVTGLDATLEKLARADPEPFVEALETNDAGILRKGLAVLSAAAQAAPLHVLEGLATAEDDEVRGLAVRAWIQHYPDRMPARRAIGLLDDLDEATRIALLRHLAVAASPDLLPRLQDWFLTRARDLTLGERRAALACMTRVAGDASPPFRPADHDSVAARRRGGSARRPSLPDPSSRPPR